MKKCVDCSIEKHETEYHWSVKGLRRKTACKACTNAKQRTRGKAKYKNERERERQTMSQEAKLFNPVLTKPWSKSHD
jgi:hypothetical protein